MIRPKGFHNDCAPSDDSLNTRTTTPHRTPTLIVLAAIVAGIALGTFEIANTSVGWHLASGRWVIEHQEFMRSDPFSFTSGGAQWIDHEWLFQVGIALVDSIGGGTGLVLFRAVAVTGLLLLLLAIGIRSGLPAAAALLLAVVCVAGARPRFFLRPELVTLIVVPAVVWLFLRRREFSSPIWLAALGGLMVIGANAHGATLVAPLLLGGILGAEAAQMAITREWSRRDLRTGLAGVATAALALLINPYGWHLYTVPLHLARLVKMPHIPNPEWISPSPAQAPALYLAIGCAVVVLALRERRAGRWILLAMASALALRHIRSIGLFFVLLPLAVAPALARLRAIAPSASTIVHRTGRANVLAATVAVVLAISLAISPWPRFGFSFADNYFPSSACNFLDAEGLPASQLYNDVRFGGYLINRYHPTREVFQDDRNEIHEPLLREIWQILASSDVPAWSEMLERYGIDAALVRYHPPIRVTTPSGEDQGMRGFSALWFPKAEWALVYWDDVAMVFVKRDGAPANLLEHHEYRVIQPDDLAHLERRFLEDPSLLKQAVAESLRALDANPDSNRARHLVGALGKLSADFGDVVIVP
jgi:hypothetical protein